MSNITPQKENLLLCDMSDNTVKFCASPWNLRRRLLMLYLYDNKGQEMKHNCVLGISLLSEVVAGTLYSPSFLTRGWKDFWMWSCWIQIILKYVVLEYDTM